MMKSSVTSRETMPRSAPGSAAGALRAVAPAPQFADTRQQATGHRALQAMANSSSRQAQQQTMQQMADNSRQTRHTVQLQAMSNSERGTAQLTKGDYGADTDHTEKIKSKQQEGLASIILDKALHQKKWRKVNRLTGELFQRSALVISLIPGILSGLGDLLTMLRDAPSVVAPQNEQSVKLMTLIDSGLDTLAGRALAWKEFDTLSMLGPLLHWLNEGIGSSYPDAVNAKLGKLRHQQALRDGVSVVAHRGAGPTNRTRGGLIQQDDPRRLLRPAENSPEALTAALSATTTVDQVGLDGVECDVFLSSDGLPILSHEGAVQEQLSAARQTVEVAITDSTHVEDLTKEQLVSVLRTSQPQSNFVDLPAFLEMTAVTAQAYFAVTNKPFRVEIEMKGKPHESVDPDRDTIKHPDTYRERLTAGVAKAISKFKKAHAALPIEIIIFNNSPDDSKAYGDLRKTKARLGGLYTGLGSNVAAAGTLAGVDELRMAATSTNAGLIADPVYKDFILTLVPGSEIDLATSDQTVNAFQPLVFTPGVDGLQQLAARLKLEKIQVEEEKIRLEKTVEDNEKAAKKIKDGTVLALRQIKKEKGELYLKRNPQPKKGADPSTVALVSTISEEEYILGMQKLVEDEKTKNAENHAAGNALTLVRSAYAAQEQKILELTSQINAAENQVKYIETVNKDMATPGLSDQEAIKEIIRQINTTRARNVHLLTDTPKNAGKYKAMIQ